MLQRPGQFSDLPISIANYVYPLFMGQTASSSGAEDSVHLTFDINLSSDLALKDCYWLWLH